MRDLLNITCNPDAVACDLHPQYMTSQYAEEISQEKEIPLVKTQHHHAHIVSVAAENSLTRDEEIIGIALDGAGYGKDGTVWGGEILKATFSDYKRVGHLEVLLMPGGDQCVYYPYRMLIAGLTNIINNDIICDITKNDVKKALPHGEIERDIILRLSKKQGVMTKSSAGRFLDSISSLIGLTYKRTYEGRPAMRLEAIAFKGNPDTINIKPKILKFNGKHILKTSEVLYSLLKMNNKAKKQDIAAFGQKYLADGMSDIAIKEAEDTGIKIVGLSGDVFVNRYIINKISDKLRKARLKVIFNE